MHGGSHAEGRYVQGCVFTHPGSSLEAQSSALGGSEKKGEALLPPMRVFNPRYIYIYMYDALRVLVPISARV